MTKLRFLVALVAAAVVASLPASAAECSGVARTGPLKNAALGALLAKQLHFKSVADPFETYSAGGWTIYGAAPTASSEEGGYLFFKGKPRETPPAYVWSGIVLPDEIDDVILDVVKGNPGIPRALARCFVQTQAGK